VYCVQRPTAIQFENSNIVKVACGFNHCLALTDEGNVWVWGRRMGHYPPNLELTVNFMESKQSDSLMQEFNQGRPRCIKNNMIFYKMKAVYAGQNNSALVSEHGQLYLQGDNSYH